MRVFEADDAPIARVVPEIADLLLFLERQADWPGGMDVTEIYLDAIAIIKCACFSKTNSVFRLAYVLTQAGRTRARDILLRRVLIEAVKSADMTKIEFDEHLTC
jgi:hypothetical protein